MQSTFDIYEFFENLLNTKLTENTKIILASGQRARAKGWLSAQGISCDPKLLNSHFTISEILSTSTKISQAGSATINNNFNLKLNSHNSSIGIDIQSISEFLPKGLPKDPKADPSLTAIFSLKELSFAESRPKPEESLTGIFAAKEAILKCIGNTSNISLNQIEILPNNSGSPTFDGYQISISHSAGFAVAVAVVAATPQDFERSKDSEYNISTKKQSSGKLSETKKILGNRTKFFIISLSLIIIMILIIKNT